MLQAKKNHTIQTHDCVIFLLKTPVQLYKLFLFLSIKSIAVLLSLAIFSEEKSLSFNKLATNSVSFDDVLIQHIRVYL